MLAKPNFFNRNVKNYWVTVGSQYKNSNDKNAQNLQIRRIYVHEQFNRVMEASRFDIALIHLKTCATYRFDLSVIVTLSSCLVLSQNFQQLC